MVEQLEGVNATLRERLDAAKARAAAAQRRTRKAREGAAQQQESEAETSTGDDGTHTAGQFTISDVQVREDFVGDFEIPRAVENTGGDVEYASMEASLFRGGSVVASLSAIESFDAGQTRTVGFSGTDKFRGLG